MAWLPQVLSLVGTVASVYGAKRAGDASAGSSEYNAQVAQENARIAQSQGFAAVQALRRDQARALGRMQALYGASGVQVDTGSPLEVLADSARSAELDVLTTQYNYDLKSRGYTDQSQLDSMNAANARRAGTLNATSAVLRGAAGYFNMNGSNAVPIFGS